MKHHVEKKEPTVINNDELANLNNNNSLVNIPYEIQLNILKNLNLKDKISYALTCKRTYHFFKSKLLQDKACMLLTFVMDANLKEINKLLNSLKSQYPNICFVTKKSQSKEACGRTWKKEISPLEFAAWAGDGEMIAELLSHVIDDDNRKLALSQLENVRRYGTEHGSCLAPLERLIKAYENYLENYSIIYKNKNKDDLFRSAIWNAQLELPIYILLWFYGASSFSPLSEFYVNSPVQRYITINRERELLANCILQAIIPDMLYRSGRKEQPATKNLQCATTKKIIESDLPAMLKLYLAKKLVLDQHILKLETINISTLTP